MRYGSSFFIYNSVLTIDFILFVLLIYQLVGNVGTPKWILVLVFLFAVYIYIFNLLYRKRLENARNNFLELSWILKL